MNAVITQMRGALDQYVASNLPALASTRKLFAERPAESDELLRLLFEEYDDGQNTDREITGLLQLKLTGFLVKTKKRAAALERQSVLRAAYEHPPTCRNAMRTVLRGVAHSGDEPDFCEKMVRDHPAVAQALLAALVQSQKRDHFYAHIAGQSVWTHSQIEIDTLQSMIARAECRRLLAEMDGDL